jgi:hypothetical protein
MNKFLAGVLGVLILGIASDSHAASTSITNKLTRVYVSNSALSILVVGNPASCPYGIVASDQDPAYDRWISLAMLSFQNQYTTVVEFDSTTCKLISLAISRS